MAQKKLTSFFTTSSPNETASDLEHEVPKSLGKTTHLQEEHPEGELNVNVLVRMWVILIILFTSLSLPKPGVIKRVAYIQEGYSQDGTVGTLG